MTSFKDVPVKLPFQRQWKTAAHVNDYDLLDLQLFFCCNLATSIAQLY